MVAPKDRWKDTGFEENSDLPDTDVQCQTIYSFIGFAPADNPKVLGLVSIAKPMGIYYEGTIAAPVLQSIFENILPLIFPKYNLLRIKI